MTVDDLVVYLDAYMDRVPSAPPAGLSALDVDHTDFVLVGHSHFDHLAGAEHIAKNTGARIIGSNETAHVMLDEGVPQEQLLRAQGGEHFRLSDTVTVRVYPNLHSCIWSTAAENPGEIAAGDYGLTEDERWPPGRRLMMPDGADSEGARVAMEHVESCTGSHETGGALAYLIETPEGSIFYHDTSGCWTRVIGDLHPDVAIIAMAGRPNVDGEPTQGSLTQFGGRVTELLKPQMLFLGHHDAWMPPRTRDMTTEEALAPVREELSRVAPGVRLANVDYLEGTRLLA